MKIAMIKTMKQMKLFLGPQHPGMHGNASVHMFVDGDIIKKSYLLPGMLHRGFEKQMERKLWVQNISLIPRVCVPEPDINEMAFAQGVEKILKLEVPEKTETKKTEETKWKDCGFPSATNFWSVDRFCQSEAIKTYQEQLNKMNCNCGETKTGKFGSDTKACTEAFQSANKLEITGQVDYATYLVYSSTRIDEWQKRCCSKKVAGICKDPVVDEVPCIHTCLYKDDCIEETKQKGKCNACRGCYTHLLILEQSCSVLAFVYSSVGEDHYGNPKSGRSSVFGIQYAQTKR